MKKKTVTGGGGPSKKKGRTARKCGVGSRASARMKTTSAQATYLEKTEDGKEKTRKRNSLKVKTGYIGGTLFEGTSDSVIRGKVNYEKRKSRNGRSLAMMYSTTLDHQSMCTRSEFGTRASDRVQKS
jgi:hypothetical protein